MTKEERNEKLKEAQKRQELFDEFVNDKDNMSEIESIAYRLYAYKNDPDFKGHIKDTILLLKFETYLGKVKG
jgi:hypothetical protein